MQAMRAWGEGRGPAPSWVLSLVQRLPEESLTAALAAGGREYFGYTRETALLGDIFDAVNVNTGATGNWKKGKVPNFPLAPRPWTTEPSASDEPPQKKRATVAELYRQFTGGKHGQ